MDVVAHRTRHTHPHVVVCGLDTLVLAGAVVSCGQEHLHLPPADNCLGSGCLKNCTSSLLLEMMQVSRSSTKQSVGEKGLPGCPP